MYYQSMDFSEIFLKAMILVLSLSHKSESSLPDCNFESGICVWRNHSENLKINWELKEMNKIGMIDPNIRHNHGLCTSSLVAKISKLFCDVSPNKMPLRCVSFMCRLKGNGHSNLTLMQLTEREKNQLWRSDKSKEISYDKWMHVNIDLKESKDYQLIFEANISPENEKVTICLDNITSSERSCKEKVPAEYIPNFYSWVNVFAWTIFCAFAFGITISISVAAVYSFQMISTRKKKREQQNRPIYELDLTGSSSLVSGSQTNPRSLGYSSSLARIGDPSLMVTRMSNQNVTTAERNIKRSLPEIAERINNEPIRINNQQCKIIEPETPLDDDAIDPLYTVCRPMVSNSYVYQSTSSTNDSDAQIGMANTNPFGTPMASRANYSEQQNLFLNDNYIQNVAVDQCRAMPGLPYYPPRYEDAVAFDQSRCRNTVEKPSLLPPRIPHRGNGPNFSSIFFRTIPPSPDNLSMPVPPRDDQINQVTEDYGENL